jgi:uncharacterized protein YqeY
VKQRRESEAVYKEQNRPELAQEEAYQAEIIEAYLPQALSEDELKAIIQEVITQTGANSIKDMGKVMGQATAKVAGRADNQTIAKIVKSLLGV